MSFVVSHYHNCFHLAIIFKFVAANIFSRRCEQMIIARRLILLSLCNQLRFFCYEVMRCVKIFYGCCILCVAIWSKVRLEKVAVPHVIKKILAFCRANSSPSSNNNLSPMSPLHTLTPFPFRLIVI
jgi:hypothetical protein